MQVPISALFRSGDAWNVFVVDGERLRQAEIEIGQMNDRTAQVLSGIAPGATLVVHPADTLSDGALVARRD